MGTPGVPLNNVTVATFTVTDPSGAPGTKWNSHITWGDGAATKLVPATPGPNNTFLFQSTHTYSAPGTYTITVMIAVPGSHKPNDNTVTTKAVIQNAATLTSIAITPANPTLARGTTRQLTATGTFSDNSTRDLTGQVTWASSNPAAATVSRTGLATGVAPGTSTVSATLNGVSGSTQVTVSTASLASIALTPASPRIGQGATQQFTATGTFTDSTTQDLTGQVTWASSNPAVASISATGLATAVAPGTSTISASMNGVTGDTDLTVNPPPPPPFPVVGVKFQARVFKTFNQFVAYFSEPHTNTQDFHAFIDWGDGSKVSRGHIHGEGDGRFAVIGMHRYVKSAIFQITVTIRDPAGRKAQAVSFVHVNKP
jgi:hypothetical protein